VATVVVDFPKNKGNFLHKNKLDIVRRYHLYHWLPVAMTVKQRNNVAASNSSQSGGPRTLWNTNRKSRRAAPMTASGRNRLRCGDAAITRIRVLLLTASATKIINSVVSVHLFVDCPFVFAVTYKPLRSLTLVFCMSTWIMTISRRHLYAQGHGPQGSRSEER